jgi:hypothetical protein
LILQKTEIILLKKGPDTNRIFLMLHCFFSQTRRNASYQKVILGRRFVPAGRDRRRGLPQRKDGLVDIALQLNRIVNPQSRATSAFVSDDRASDSRRCWQELRGAPMHLRMTAPLFSSTKQLSLF